MENNLLNAALKYATKYGWAVFPCSPNTKKPLTPHGCKDAKKDPGAIRAWWKRYPDAGIGIATGAISNLIVIDEDIDEDKGVDGCHAVILWERDNGDFPDTVVSITGRGGRHLYFKYDGEDIKNRAGIIDGVDVRGQGGYVIAPPSVHPNGTVYEWEAPPEETEIATVNDTIHKFLAIGAEKKEVGETFKLPQMIGEGQRNSTMHKLACSMQAQGLSDDAILSAVRSENASRCNPPLSDSEIETIVKSALRYKKGELKTIDLPDDPIRPVKLSYKLDSKGELTDKPAQTIANAEEAINYDTNLHGRIRYNEISYTISVYGDLPWCKYHGWREWTNNDDGNLWSYIENKYGLTNKDKIYTALNNVAHKHHVNQIKDMLESCHDQWDGNAHIETLLPRFVGADKTDYNTAVMRLFMLGAIKRIYHPGCKFDYMLILVGTQGTYKSSFLRFLAINDNWFNDNFNTLDGDKAFEKLRGMWMVELSELQATKRAKDVESIKAFITSRCDTYRAAYDRRTESHPRQCVLAGTSNPVDFLTDRTGNRRFLPVTCSLHEIENPFDNEIGTKAEFLQAWGEAMDIYLRAGDKIRLVLPKQFEKQAIEAQSAYTEDDPDIGIIQQWLDSGEHPERVCVRMIWDKAFKYLYTPITKQEINRIHEIMKNSITGWHYVGKQKCGIYGTQRCYERDIGKKLP